MSVFAPRHNRRPTPAQQPFHSAGNPDVAREAQPRPAGRGGEDGEMHPITAIADPPFPQDSTEIFQECFEYALDMKRQDGVSLMIGTFRAKLAKCESPIERRLFSALYGTLAGYTFDCGGLTPQAVIGPYRVDFLLRLPVRGAQSVDVVIECDGHDFHERTKHQARRDKARDRYLESLGYRVVRFAGSEIWANPLRCAEQALIVAFGNRHRMRSGGGE